MPEPPQELRQEPPQEPTQPSPPEPAKEPVLSSVTPPEPIPKTDTVTNTPKTKSIQSSALPLEPIVETVTKELKTKSVKPRPTGRTHRHKKLVRHLSTPADWTEHLSESREPSKSTGGDGGMKGMVWNSNCRCTSNDIRLS